MPRTSTQPRLDTLDPAKISAAAVASYREHLIDVVRWLPFETVNVSRIQATFGIRLAQLTLYAQHGEATGLYPDGEAGAFLAAESLSRTYHASCGTPQLSERDVAGLEPRAAHDPVALVFVAVRARQNLSQGAGVSVWQLAALSSRSTSHVYKCVKLGQISLTAGGLVPAPEACRWLRGLGVPGIAAKKA